jgi:KUP system potassium uptake protein
MSLTQHIRHNRSLQKRVLLISVVTLEVPRVPEADRAQVSPITTAMDRVVLRFGFMEHIDVPAGLACAGLFTPEELEQISYYLGRETVIADAVIQGMAPWREQLFVSMQRNTAPTGDSFCIPSAQLVEIGTEVRI